MVSADYELGFDGYQPTTVSVEYVEPTTEAECSCGGCRRVAGLDAIDATHGPVSQCPHLSRLDRLDGRRCTECDATYNDSPSEVFLGTAVAPPPMALQRYLPLN